MYLCGVCESVVGPRVPMLRHVVYRRNGQISREIPVCGDCHTDLRLAGVPLAELVAERQRELRKLRRKVAEAGPLYNRRVVLGTPVTHRPVPGPAPGRN